MNDVWDEIRGNSALCDVLSDMRVLELKLRLDMSALSDQHIAITQLLNSSYLDSSQEHALLGILHVLDVLREDEEPPMVECVSGS